jgi:hypothetical protein
VSSGGLLGGRAAVAVRLMPPAAIGRLMAVTAFALLLGSVAGSSTSDVTASLARIVGQRGVRREEGHSA